jgi:hypothetical protein
MRPRCGSGSSCHAALSIADSRVGSACACMMCLQTFLASRLQTGRRQDRIVAAGDARRPRHRQPAPLRPRPRNQHAARRHGPRGAAAHRLLHRRRGREAGGALPARRAAHARRARAPRGAGHACDGKPWVLPAQGGARCELLQMRRCGALVQGIATCTAQGLGCIPFERDACRLLCCGIRTVFGSRSAAQVRGVCSLQRAAAGTCTR